MQTALCTPGKGNGGFAAHLQDGKLFARILGPNQGRQTDCQLACLPGWLCSNFGILYLWGIALNTSFLSADLRNA